MASYVEKLLATEGVCAINDERTIYTDRMGPWKNQDVVLTWEGEQEKEFISVTPDEVDVLFKNGKTRNVYRGEDGRLYKGWIFADYRYFPGAIVCGVMAPSTAASMRPEILEYAKKMGYVTDKMTPVVMTSGTKSLFSNNGTYNIYYEWSDEVLGRINRKFLINFTRSFFQAAKVEILGSGVLICDLPEQVAFSRENIDQLRVYDIQLKYLDPAVDKVLLMRSAVQVACIDMPINILRHVRFSGNRRIRIPEDRIDSLTFNEYGKVQLNCGKASYSSEGKNEEYVYRIQVPYSEAVRELFCDVEAVLKARYGEQVYVGFYKFQECLHICCNGKDIGHDVERALIGVDYALMLLRDETAFNTPLFYDAIFSLLEADSSGIFKKEYFSYIEEVKKALPEKIDFM